MTDMKLENVIDCSSVSSAEANNKINDLYLQKIKQVVLKNASDKKGLLNSLAIGVKVEIIGDVNSLFGNNLSNAKVIVNGNVGDDSATSTKSAKITLFGSCGNNFGNESCSSEFYVFKNCGQACLKSINSSKAVIGGIPGSDFLCDAESSTIVVLNLKGGKLFVDQGLNWMDNTKNIEIYVRGKIDVSDSLLKVDATDENDEDKYLPLISEFARLFKFSLSEIKSLPFYKLTLK